MAWAKTMEQLLERMVDRIRGDPEYAADIAEYDEIMKEPTTEILENMELDEVKEIFDLVARAVADSLWGDEQNRLVATPILRPVLEKFLGATKGTSQNEMMRAQRLITKPVTTKRLESMLQITLEHVQDTFAALHNDAILSLEAVKSLHWQVDKELEFPMRTGEKKWILSGCTSYMLSYGSPDEIEKNCVIIQARESGSWSRGEAPMLGCMAMIQEHREIFGIAPKPIFGIATDSYSFWLCVMNEEGIYEERWRKLGQCEEQDLEVISYLARMIIMAASQALSV